jgi:hypothetical protein
MKQYPVNMPTMGISPSTLSRTLVHGFSSEIDRRGAAAPGAFASTPGANTSYCAFHSDFMPCRLIEPTGAPVAASVNW